MAPSRAERAILHFILWSYAALFFTPCAAGARPGPVDAPAKTKSTVPGNPAENQPPPPPPAEAPAGRPVDLGQVHGIDRLPADSAVRALLARNGFVVVPHFYKQIFSPYLHSGLPPFVTVDSLHRTFQVIFEEQLKAVETAVGQEVAALTVALQASLNDRVQQGAGHSGSPAAQTLAGQYLFVASCLQAGTAAPPAAGPAVSAELRLIREARGIALSPLFGYQMDYSLYKPRGFYDTTPTLSRHFQTLSWYGMPTFRLLSDVETEAALLLTEALAADPANLARWRSIDALYTRLLAPADDLTPEEYLKIHQDLASPAAPRPSISQFREAATARRDPVVNGLLPPPDPSSRGPAAGKGWRLIGQRRVPDAEALQQVIDPFVPGRRLPSGLDLMAALGSQRAAALSLAGQPDPAAFAAALQSAKRTVEARTATPDPSAYILSLELIRTLLSPPDPAAPAFMHTPAYADKNLTTALAAWTALRHAWVLAVKANLSGIGLLRQPPAGFVEPNFAFLEGLHRLVRKTVDLIGTFQGVEVSRLQRFDRLVLDLTAIARSLNRGAALSEADNARLHGYGEELARLTPDNRYLDPWGQPYHCRRSAPDATGVCTVWSSGPDRNDDGGTKDDIVGQEVRKTPLKPLFDWVFPPPSAPGAPPPPPEPPAKRPTEN